MNKEIIEYLMDKYAQGTLTVDEQKQLDALVQDTPDLKMELIIRKDIVKSVKHLEKKELIGLIEKIHDEEIKKPKSKSRLMKGFAFVALLLMMGFAFITMLNNSNKELDANKLFASNYQTYEPVTASRGQSQDNQTELFTQEYLAKNFESALSLIMPNIDNQTNEVVLMAAISAIEIKDNATAFKLLDKIIQEEDYYLTDKARWYKALLFLKDSNLTEAKKELGIIVSDPSADHFKEATMLLSKIK